MNYYKTKGKEQSYWGVKPDHQHCKFAIQNFICKGKQKKKKRKEKKARKKEGSNEEAASFTWILEENENVFWEEAVQSSHFLL